MFRRFLKCSLYHLHFLEEVLGHTTTACILLNYCIFNRPLSFQKRKKVPNQIEEQYIPWNLGSSEGPNLIWWNAKVSEIWTTNVG